VTPFTHPDSFYAVFFDGQRSPGKVVLSGHDRNPDWEEKKSKGQDGASTHLNGFPPGSFTATFFLTTTEEIEAWDDFQKAIESTTSGPEPVAKPIYHPDLARNKYASVCNAGIGGMVHYDFGGATVQVKFREHKPAKKRTPAKATAKPAAPNTSPENDPLAAARAELAALTAEAQQP
jgi:hypothetical protein